MKNEIKLFIADDHPVFRAGLKVLIEKDAQMKIVGEANDGTEALEKVFQAGADIAILDIDMPGKDGFEVAQKIRENNLPTEIIFLTMHKDEHFLNRALELSVKGYLIKESAVTDIINCIKNVADGRIFISPAISGLLLKRTRQAEKTKETNLNLESLTETERRILSMIAEYKTSREIADELFVSFRTIENHRANISRKLDIKGNHALIKYAVENKLLIK
jgi:two-component system, NarL family, response regulator DegU